MVYTEKRYQALVEDIFKRFPSVQKDGFTPGAYKPGLDRMRAFDKALGYPSRQFKAIHIAGTNGKGSVANMLASALVADGCKTGLFTSPHILDFRERIRSFGAKAPQDDKRHCHSGTSCHSAPLCHSERSEESIKNLVPKEFVYQFLTAWLPWITEHQLSFFEITTGMAFQWFAQSKVDYAVIETGLGGRLDSTNVLEKPVLSIVTTIGLDHMAMLGDTVEQIAAEKAGIFKEGVPALVGEATEQTRPVFNVKAEGLCPLYYAQELNPANWEGRQEILRCMDLQAKVQEKNLRTVLAALDIIGHNTSKAIDGIIHTARNMDFHGRWERLQDKPLVIADIGHNAHALQHNFTQLQALGRPMIIVYGIMADKDLAAIVPLMPRDATYIFTAPSTPRALPADDILSRFTLKCRRCANFSGPATQIGITSEKPSQVSEKTRTCDTKAGDLRRAIAISNVQDAVRKALEMATEDTVIYIGGSTFVVSEALPLFQ